MLSGAGSTAKKLVMPGRIGDVQNCDKGRTRAIVETKPQGQGSVF